MTRILHLLLWMVLCGAVSLPAFAGQPQEPVNLVSPDELKSMLDRPDLTIIDVRRKPDFDSSAYMIKGAVYEDPAKIGQWMAKYPKDRTYVFYCA